MMTSGVSFLASLANRVSFEHCTQGTPLLLPSHRPQLLVIAQFPDELEYLRTGLESLLRGEFAGRTSKEVLEHVTIPVKSAHDETREGFLNVPDLPGERILRVYELRQWDALWEDRIVEGCGCLMFIRACSDEIVRPLDYAECLRLFGATLKQNTPAAAKALAKSEASEYQSERPTAATKSAEPNALAAEPSDKQQSDNPAAIPKSEAGKAPGPPTDVVLTDWLQFLRRAFTDRVSGSYRPKVGIVIAAWDGVPKDSQCKPPFDYLAENFPLLQQFIETNGDRFDFQMFGLSILGGDLKNDAEFRAAFTKGKPNDFGYVIHSLNGGIEKVNDVTVPVAWALGWFPPTVPTETKP